MGLNFRKSIKFGPARINISKSGVGYSVGAGGLRYTKSAKRKKKVEKKGFWASLGTLMLVCLLIGFVAKYAHIIVIALVLAAAVVAVFFGVRAYKAKHPLQQIESADPIDDNIVDGQ